MNTKMKDVILTGLRANSDLHIGHFLGPMPPMINMAKKHADDYEVNMFVADLHSFITPIDHTQLYDQIINNVRLYVAAGLPLDTPGINVYRQSKIPAHSELTWILNCFTGMGQMSRMTQYKDKSAKLGDEQINVGLFDYPVLMAADILLYGAKYVPVGEDQTQHLEFTRDIAERINNKFGDLFVVPEPVPKQHEFFGKDQGLRIKDLQDPTKKMSKSDETGKGVLFLGDEPSAAAKKVMSATTDSVGEIHFDWQTQPGITNLLQILALLTHHDQAHVNAEWEGKTSYGEFKQAVAHEVENFLADFQVRLVNVDDEMIIRKLEQSEAAMTIIANQTLLRVQQAVGLRA